MIMQINALNGMMTQPVNLIASQQNPQQTGTPSLQPGWVMENGRWVQTGAVKTQEGGKTKGTKKETKEEEHWKTVTTKKKKKQPKKTGDQTGDKAQEKELEKIDTLQQDGWTIPVTTCNKEGLDKTGGVMLVSSVEGRELLETLKPKAPTVLVATKALNEEAVKEDVLVTDKHGKIASRTRFLHKLGPGAEEVKYKPQVAEKTVKEDTVQMILTVVQQWCTKER